MSLEEKRDRKRSREESITQGLQCSNIENSEFSTETPKQCDIEASANEYSEKHSQVSKTEKQSREDSHVFDIEGQKIKDLLTSNKEKTKSDDPQVSNTDILKDIEDFKMKKLKLESKQGSKIQLTTEDLDSSIEKSKHSRKRTSNMEEVETGNQQASNSKQLKKEKVAAIKKPKVDDPKVVKISTEKLETLPLLGLKSEDSVIPLHGKRDNSIVPSLMYHSEASTMPRHGRNDSRLPSPLFESRETNPSESRETNPSESRETNPSESRETNPRTSNTSRVGEQLLALATSDNIQPTDSAVQENLTETSLPNYDLVLRLNLSDNRPSEGENNCVLRPSSEVDVLCELPRNTSPILLNIALAGQSQTSGNISNLNTEERTEHQDNDSERHRSISTEASTSNPVLNRENLDHQSAIEDLVRMLYIESPDPEFSIYIRERFLRDAESYMVTEIKREFGENFDIDDLTGHMPVNTRPHFMQIKSLLRDFVNLRTLVKFRFQVYITVDYKNIVPGFFDATESNDPYDLGNINDIPQTFKKIFKIEYRDISFRLLSLSRRSLHAIDFFIKVLTRLMKVCFQINSSNINIILKNFLKVSNSCLHWYKLRDYESLFEDLWLTKEQKPLMFFLNLDSQISALLYKLNMEILNIYARPF